jgi:ribonuclease P protein component
MRQKQASFTKGERLCSVTAVRDLFAAGSTLSIPPLRIIYRIMPEDKASVPVRVLISVPKRYFRKAVQRNLIRRRIREAYRKNKITLINTFSGSGNHLDLAIIWNDTAIHPYNVTERCIKEMTEKLSHLK